MRQYDRPSQLSSYNDGERPKIHSWRRRRDSNPRYALSAYNGLANRRLQPLGHVSGQEKVLEINTFSVNGRLRRERTEREQNGPSVAQKGE